jgi:hypothetical protein
VMAVDLPYEGLEVSEFLARERCSKSSKSNGGHGWALHGQEIE